MPTKPSVAIQTSNTQAKNRKLVTVRDSHRSSRFPEGRPWWGYAERPADAGNPWGFVGSLNPGNHENPFQDVWEAPWLPDAKWLIPNVETGKMTINYVGMIAEYTTATRKYYEKCAEVGHENKWPAPSFGGPVEGRFRAVVGRDLPQSPKIPQAAQAGDPWILGFTSEINESLSKILRGTTFGSGVTVMETPAEIVPVATPAVNATPNIQAMIDEAVAKALAAQPVKTPSPAKLAAAAKMRAAKEAKKVSQAQAQAA